jgi:CRP-like cAMP-binding protein
MIDRHLMKLRARSAISTEEEAVIRAAVSGARCLKPGEALVRAFEPSSVSSILVSGLAARVNQMLDGRRQISELHVAGDFVDLHSFTLKHLDHDVVAMTDCEFALVPHDNIRDIIQRYPRLGQIWWFSTNVDASIHREWLVSVGRRQAMGRLAHLFCELHLRLSIVDLVKDNTYDLPLTQAEVAECVGLTDVHVNRTLMQLRARKLLEFKGARLAILDLEGLAEIAEFDAGYLYVREEQASPASTF